MGNLSRMLELAGLAEKSYTTKQLYEYTIEELETRKASLLSQIRGSIMVTEHVDNLRVFLRQVDQTLEEKLADLAKKGEVKLCKKCKEDKEHDDAACKCECHKEKALVEEGLIEQVKDGAELQDSQPTSAQETDEVGNVFDGHDEEQGNKTELQQDAMGVTQDRETKVAVPREVFQQIDQRIKELKQSIAIYDKTTYVEQYSNKQKAIENLEFLRDKLKMGNMEGYKQAQIHYGTLASIFAGDLFPAKLVDFLHDGQASEKREVAYNDNMKGDPNKPAESEVANNSIYKPLDTSIYPQKNNGDQKPE